ncbi:MAG: RnfABCDGE type electron transport complex subunit A [Actinobacteria bacterium]|nr:RnfABCDGE type electron transport complex subunit A [Actinomycetota bacterium]
MDQVVHLGLLLIGAALVNNIILVRFIGLCPFFGVSTKIETSIGMSLAVTFVMTLASAISWIVFKFLLVPFKLDGFLYIITFILVIASLVQLVEIVLRKTSPSLYKAMGIYLPLITTNCAVLAAATESVKPGFFKMAIAYNYSFIEAVVYSLGIALGFGFIIITFAAIRERLELAPVPEILKGTPIAFITAALFSFAFIGFSGLFGL